MVRGVKGVGEGEGRGVDTDEKFLVCCICCQLTASPLF